MKRILNFLNPKRFSMGLQLGIILILFFLCFGIVEISLVNDTIKKAKLSNKTEDLVEEFIKTNPTEAEMSSFASENLFIVLPINNEIIDSTGYETNKILLAFLDKDDISYSLSDEINRAQFEYEDNKVYVFSTSTTLVLVPTQINLDYLDSLTLYQGVTILAILLMGLGLAVIFHHLYIEPITEMTLVTTKIKNLQFSFQATGFCNKTYSDLGDQINELSKSLKSVIDNLNFKNDEITKYVSAQDREYDFQKQLVATISHEIKTPLAVMQATISGIIDGIFPQEEVNFELNNLLNEIDKTNKMLQEIVDLYKMETSSFKLEIINFNLNDLLMKTIHNLQKISDKYEQKIVFDPKSEVLVNADINQMTRVLNNVILNGIIYSPKGNEITIDIYDKVHYYVLEIINYGVTINKSDIEKVFEPFYRADKSRQKKEDHGNGLGLYLVKEVLQKHEFDYGIENLENAVKFYIIFKK